jgi:hypothetical protein
VSTATEDMFDSILSRYHEWLDKIYVFSAYRSFHLVPGPKCRGLGRSHAVHVCPSRFHGSQPLALERETLGTQVPVETETVVGAELVVVREMGSKGVLA